MFIPSVMLSRMPAFQQERMERFDLLCAKETDVCMCCVVYHEQSGALEYSVKNV
jgi:hypothetical protein